ncbi:WYL domain-containing protein [Magnetospirillum sp. SS-4]|uniref:WYL domain-containing protein n=1 Tax=Magnetospirillum sp. SS-4 TaxID=2681465 RepID=UPI001380DA93|nr:WYL domain-containing protein [Magnetospirillum sp. SS-4]CAA7617452.1 Transcriptional regulator [Magnetospirillum sp. SS-4]
MNQATKLRHGAEQRLEFVEFRLFWEGRVNRSDITSRFGVSVPQASNDLSRYQELAPGNVRYDTREKCYLPSDAFSPKFLKLNAGRYLAQLQGLVENAVDMGDTWIAEMPAASVLPVPSRNVDPVLLKAFVGAIRRRRSLNVHYHSMNPKRPDAIWRRITPHAFGFDGLRWHVRGFCHVDRVFKDFILSRCLEVEDEGEPGAPQSDDHLWTESFDVILAPNPDLALPQQRTIQVDYGMTDGRIIIPVRRAMLYYFNKRLRLDVAEHLDRPEETPVVVENHDAFRRVLAEVSAQ